MYEDENKLSVNTIEVPEKKYLKIVKISGDIDILTITKLHKSLDPMIITNNILLLDLKSLNSINSLGLAIFIRIYTITGFLGLIMSQDNHVVNDILLHAGILNFAKVYSNQQEAIDKTEQNAIP